MDVLRRSRRSVLVASTLAVAAFVAPSFATAAPTATAGGGVATFTDPDGNADALSITLGRADAGSIDPAGFNVAFFQLTPGVVPGAGCQAGLVGVLCPFGGAAPAGVNVDLGAGNDEATLEVTDAAKDAPTAITVQGGPGNDRLAKIRAKATLDGGDGDDLLLPDEVRPFAPAPGPTPGETIRGGAGTDTVAYGSTPEGVTVTLDGVANDGRRGENDNVAADIENVRGPGFPSTITGSAGNNRIEGGSAGDTLAGGAGVDELIGGGGADTLNVLDGAGGDTVNCGDGDDLAYVDSGDLAPTTSGCETVVWAPALTSKRLRFSKKRIRVGLKCPTTATGASMGCNGTLVITSTAAKPVTLARARYDVARGKKATLTLKPTSAGRRALKKKAINARALLQLDGGTPATGPLIKIRR